MQVSIFWEQTPKAAFETATTRDELWIATHVAWQKITHTVSDPSPSPKQHNHTQGKPAHIFCKPWVQTKVTRAHGTQRALLSLKGRPGNWATGVKSKYQTEGVPERRMIQTGSIPASMMAATSEVGLPL